MTATLAAAWVAMALAACGGTLPTPSPPTLPGTPGHFDNGEFAFDYPADWPLLVAGRPSVMGVFYIVAVLGTGSWYENCLKTDVTDSGYSVACSGDVVDVPPGGIVVKVYWRLGGPAPMCQSPVPTANASAGPNSVLRTVDGNVTTWEFAWPGAQFYWPNNPTFEVHTSDAAQFAKAEAMVASFRWEKGSGPPGLDCGSPAAS